MRPRQLVLLTCALLCTSLTVSLAQPAITNGLVTVAAVGEKGAYTGFRLAKGEDEIAVVRFGSLDNITARQARQEGQALAFTGLRAEPTPRLGKGSEVVVTLRPDDPYPEVSFRLDVRGFDREAWEGVHGEAPLHFLACALPGAEVFHQRGWPIATPVVDEYPLHQCEGFGKQMVSFWSREWTNCPPLGAHPMPTVGLWKAAAKKYVAYDFHGARLTDNSERLVGTGYCFKHQDAGEFFCLVWPYPLRYRELRYPEEPAVIATKFTLLHSDAIAGDDDPNLFVTEFIWQRYADLLPAAPDLNDLSWVPGDLRPSSFPTPGPARLYHTDGEDARWMKPGSITANGVGYFSPVDHWFETNNEEALAQLQKDLMFLVPRAERFEVEGDQCVFWQKPVTGDGAEMFGPGVPTLRNVQGWGMGLALLDTYRNQPDKAKPLLPYVDGVLRWTKHILYTRNGYPDVPGAQFAWGATPVATFCLRYHYTFRDDPERQELAALALKLARSMTYRYLAIWTSDSDKFDEIDSAFFMEPNAGHMWLGSACSNEVWVVCVALAEVYVATGDPVLGYYLRGMLEKWHELYRDTVAPSIVAYRSGDQTERYGLFDECAQGKGVRGDFGGLWGGFERLCWPMGDSVARVICGEQAALAFNRDGRHTNIARYRHYGDGACSFEVVAAGQAIPGGDGSFGLMVTFPFFDLRGHEVTLRRGGLRLKPEVTTYAQAPDSISIAGVRHGDIVAVGRHDPDVAPKACRLQKPRRVAEERLLTQDGFRMVNLAYGVQTEARRDWSDVESYAGLEPGRKVIFGVPFEVPPAEPGTGLGAIRNEGVAIGEEPEWLFCLVAPDEDRSRLVLYYEEGGHDWVPLEEAVPVLRGWPPVFGWHVDLVAFHVGGKKIGSIKPTNADLFAVTGTSKTAEELADTFAVLGKKREQMRADRATVARIKELAPMFERMSGRIALLPIPLGEARRTGIGRLLQRAGVWEHTVAITPEQLVDPSFFGASRFWVTLYVGGEAYYQTVQQEGDGDEALRRYLAEGGTLLALPSGPFPFYYNERDKSVVSAGSFGLPICGSGAFDRLDQIEQARVRGWETPPEGVQLHFERAPEQEAVVSVPERFEWLGEGDPRWRPIVNVIGDTGKYTPLITLRDQTGADYGQAAAVIEYTQGDLKGGRVGYAWSTLTGSKEHGAALVGDMLRWALGLALPPPAKGTATRTEATITVDGKLDERAWADAEALPLVFVAGHDFVPTLKTEARLLWDDRNLYCGFTCEDDDIMVTKTQRDDSLWEEEVVEIFVDTTSTGRDYEEFEVNPLGTEIDLLIADPRQGSWQEKAEWNAEGWKSAVHVDGDPTQRGTDDKSWTCEMLIPLACLGAPQLPPKVGETWRVALYRKDRAARLGDMQHEMTWSAVHRSMHETDRFGFITFRGSPYRDDFSAYAEGADGRPQWSLQRGQWAVREGAFVGTDCLMGGWRASGARMGSDDWRDCTLRARFRIIERGTDHRDGPWFAVRDTPGAAYGVNFLGEAIRLHKFAAGRGTNDDVMLGQAQWQADDRWHQVEITVRGVRLTVALDGKQVLEAEDEGLLGVPPVERGGIVLCARRWDQSQGHTVVAFDDVDVEVLY